jgi:hypothetical protein
MGFLLEVEIRAPPYKYWQTITDFCASEFLCECDSGRQLPSRILCYYHRFVYSHRIHVRGVRRIFLRFFW